MFWLAVPNRGVPNPAGDTVPNSPPPVLGPIVGSGLPGNPTPGLAGMPPATAAAASPGCACPTGAASAAAAVGCLAAPSRRRCSSLSSSAKGSLQRSRVGGGRQFVLVGSCTGRCRGQVAHHHLARCWFQAEPGLAPRLAGHPPVVPGSPQLREVGLLGCLQPVVQGLVGRGGDRREGPAGRQAGQGGRWAEASVDPGRRAGRQAGRQAAMPLGSSGNAAS